MVEKVTKIVVDLDSRSRPTDEDKATTIITTEYDGLKMKSQKIEHVIHA